MRHRQVDKSLTGTSEIFVVFREASVPAQPGEGALHNPAFWLDYKAFHAGFTSDDLHEPGVDFVCPLQPQAPICLVSVDDEQTRQRVASPLHERSCTFLVGECCRMHHYHQQEAERVHQDVTLTSLDVLATIVPNGVCYLVAPPFSAVFTDWLSRIATLGSGSLHSSTLNLRRNCVLIFSNTPASRHCAKYPYTVSQGGKS